jgi:hypothetical protein
MDCHLLCSVGSSLCDKLISHSFLPGMCVIQILVAVHSCIYVRYTNSLFMWKFHSEYAALRVLHTCTIKELNTLIYAAKILGTNKNQTTQE